MNVLLPGGDDNGVLCPAVTAYLYNLPGGGDLGQDNETSVGFFRQTLFETEYLTRLGCTSSDVWSVRYTHYVRHDFLNSNGHSVSLEDTATC